MEGERETWRERGRKGGKEWDREIKEKREKEKKEEINGESCWEFYNWLLIVVKGMSL